MKKLVNLTLVAAAVLALGACSTSQHHGGAVVHNNEEAAPYADERTVGRNTAPERTFEAVQRK
jgi:hypothetical protein